MSSDLRRPRLFFTPDTCALASLITCFDAGLDPEIIPISFEREEQKSEAYSATNPKARVPAIQFGDIVVTETPAILVLISQLAPEAALASTDPFQFAALQEFNSYICSTLHVAHAHRMRGHRWVDGEDHEEAMRRKVPDSVGGCYAYIEEHAFTAPYVFGDAYTISDPYLFTLAQWMEADGVDPGAFPKIDAFRTRMRKRSSVARALDVEAALRAKNG